ncbi:MAG: YceI family protein [Gemmatimonadaceae bacterium]
MASLAGAQSSAHSIKNATVAAAGRTALSRTDVPVTYRIDPVHSELTFRIRHLVGRVSGSFDEWSGSISADTANWANSNVSVEIKTASIDTKQPNRDADLRSARFFAADSFPTITFKSTRIERQGDNVKLIGDLTMRGRTKPVTLSGKFLGATKDVKGQRVGFDVSTTINRQDYGVSWNRVVETGMYLGDDVEIAATIEAVRQE